MCKNVRKEKDYEKEILRKFRASIFETSTFEFATISSGSYRSRQISWTPNRARKVTMVESGISVGQDKTFD